MFQFKQFSVDQKGCAMKINTDGVLLGALTSAENPLAILDIGTGTGVIALMLAQRFTCTQIDAVEIDASAAETAALNFKNSIFNERLEAFPVSIAAFFNHHPDNKYDLIVSNPPFYIKSLESPEAKRSLAKHTDLDFFEELMKYVAQYLTNSGLCWLILPVQTAALIKQFALQNGLIPQETTDIRSFENAEPHRQIVCFGFDNVSAKTGNFIIYEAAGIYSVEYRRLLQPYFLNF
jgi:tRNA1Val (adenine37-N6)-methyltransferase